MSFDYDYIYQTLKKANNTKSKSIINLVQKLKTQLFILQEVYFTQKQKECVQFLIDCCNQILE